MRPARLMPVAASAVAALVLAACGSAAPALSTPTAPRDAIPAAHASAARLSDWPEFDLNAQRSGVSEASSGITVSDLAHLRRITVRLAGTVDSSPVYVHGVPVAGGTHNLIVVTTTYGRTVAVDADSGSIVWTFTPPGYSGWAASAQITTATPAVDPGRQFVYAASPDGLIHKLALANGVEDRSGSWPTHITHDPHHEKIAAALNVDGADVLAATGGYYGDAPPYQGHLVAIDRSSGRVRAVFNTLCANRRELLVPGSCSASDSAIWARAGAVVEPGGARVVIDTGNGPYNGVTNFGDSVLELSFPNLDLRQSFTPANQQQLNSSDTDLGSGSPALLGSDRVLVAGKDGVMRVLVLSRLDGHPPSRRTHPTGGEAQRLSTPGGDELLTAPAVWRHGSRTTVFVADASGTAAFALRGGRLYRVWQNGNAGTSPVMVGGLLYVYDPAAGGIYVYRPGSPRPLVKLPGSAGHWNSPIVVDGHVVEPEGNANDHSQSGTLDIFLAA